MAEIAQHSVQVSPLIVTVNPTNPATKYKSKYKVLGIVQVILASLSILLGIIIIPVTAPYDTFAYIGTGIWSGLVFLAPGILGIVSGKNPTRCPIIGALVMTIIAAVFAVNMIILEISGAVLADEYYDRVVSSSNIGFHSVLAAISIIVLITAIVHSAYCCAGTNCCCADAGNQQVIYAPQAGAYPNQVLLQNPGNPAMPVQIVYQGNVGGIQTTSIPQQQQQFAQQQQYFVQQQQQFAQQQFIQQHTVPPQAPPYTELSPPLYQRQPQQDMNGVQTKLPL